MSDDEKQITKKLYEQNVAQYVSKIAELKVALATHENALEFFRAQLEALK